MTHPHRHFTTLLLGAGLITSLAGCGRNTGPGASDKKQDRADPIVEELKLEGKYEVKFSPMNSSVSGFTSAKGKFHLVADKIQTEITVKDAPAKNANFQFIYTGTECPTEAHDTNSDGFIDALEAAKVVGKILIPLDADLDSQLAGSDAFPISDSLGGYVYFKEGSISKLVSDLKVPDMDIKDELAKLALKEDLKLEGKVVLIQGVPEGVYLPGSVRTFGQLSERSTLSIACGKIKRVMNPETPTGGPEERN